MLRIEGIYTYITVLGVLSSVLCQIDHNNSQFRLVSPAARSRVKHGDNLTYMFSITLNISSPADYISIFVNGSNLQALDTSDLLETNFTWQTTDGRTVDIDNPYVDVEVVKESESHPVSEIDLQIPLNVGELKLQRLSGKMELHVASTASLGSILRPVMFISLFLEHRVFYQNNILGDYVFMQLPEIEVSEPEPRALEMKEEATIASRVLLPTIPLKSSLLNVYMPRNLSVKFDTNNLFSEEPYLTVTDFQFVGYSGLFVDSSRLNSDNNPVYLSSTRTSETDGIVFAIPSLNYTAGASNLSSELDFVMKVESLDFVGSKESSEMKIVYILDFGDHFFIIRNSSLLVNRSLDVERTPKVNFTLDLMETVTESKQTTVEYVFRIWHAGNASWSSAYNISVVLYLPPFLHGVDMLRTKDVIKTNTAVETIVHENCLLFRIHRVSFVHNVRLQFRVILDTANKQYKRNNEFLIIAEAIYTGWRTVEYFRDAVGFSIIYNETKENEVAPICECIPDGFAQCRCTKVNNCNGMIDNVSCVDCNYPWHCVRTLKGYRKKSKLKGDGGIAYICAAARRYRKSWDTIPCTKQYTNGTTKRLSPVISTILGRDKNKGYLYGISQNGLAYVISTDDGITWYSIHPKIYAHAQHSLMFEMAVLK